MNLLFLFFSSILSNLERPPNGIRLEPISSLNDLAKAISLWPNRIHTPNALDYLERAAKYNPSVGAFTEDGTLVSWIFGYDCLQCCLTNMSDIHPLHTLAHTFHTTFIGLRLVRWELFKPMANTCAKDTDRWYWEHYARKSLNEAMIFMQPPPKTMLNRVDSWVVSVLWKSDVDVRST